MQCLLSVGEFQVLYSPKADGTSEIAVDFQNTKESNNPKPDFLIELHCDSYHTLLNIASHLSNDIQIEM